MKKEYVIDGKNFSDRNGFYEEVSQKVLTAEWGKNLDAFNDVLYGGFGTPKEGFILIWENSEKSKKDLDKDFDTLIEIIKVHEDIELKLK